MLDSFLLDKCFYRPFCRFLVYYYLRDNEPKETCIFTLGIVCQRVVLIEDKFFDVHKAQIVEEISRLERI